MKILTILFLATVIASDDASLKCQEVTDSCTSVRADAAPIYENANSTLKAIENRCKAQLEAAEPNAIGQISSNCSGDLTDVMYSTVSVLGSFLGLDPPDSFFNTFFATEREGMSACLVETDVSLQHLLNKF